LEYLAAGLLLYTLGYTESFAEELRQAGPVWVCDAEAAARLLRDAVGDAAGGAAACAPAVRENAD